MQPVIKTTSRVDVVGVADAQRVSQAVADFHRCFDAAMGQPSTNTADRLREATDRLMRAAARVLIGLGSPRDDLPS